MAALGNRERKPPEERGHGHIAVIGRLPGETLTEKYGEELCAWVILREGSSASEDEIRDFCRGKIAHFKIPRYVKFTNELPMTVTGKIQKYKMREVSTAELHLEAAAKIVTA